VLKKLKPKSEFSKNVLTLMTGTTIAQAIPIAISPILTRIYTPEDFGIFALFMALVGMFSSIASGRYELALLLPKKDEDAFNILVLSFIIICILSFLLLIGILFLHDSIISLLQNDAISIWLYFIPLALFLVGSFNLLTYYNNRKNMYRDIAQATIVKSLVLVVVQLGIGSLKSGVSGLVSGQIISQAFANVKLIKNVFSRRFFNAISFVKMFALARKYKNFPKFQAPHAFLNTLSSSAPIYFFTIFLTSSVVGLFSLSTKIVLTPLMILSSATAKVYNQKVSMLFYKKLDCYTFTLKLLYSLVKKILLPFIVFIFFAPDIFTFLFGLEWREAGVYTQILSPWLFMVFLVGSVSYIPSLLSLQKRAFILEIIYTFLRISSLFLGLYFFDIYYALIFFSSIGFLMLSYNLYWMLHSLKEIQ